MSNPLYSTRCKHATERKFSTTTDKTKTHARKLYTLYYIHANYRRFHSIAKYSQYMSNYKIHVISIQTLAPNIYTAIAYTECTDYRQTTSTGC